MIAADASIDSILHEIIAGIQVQDPDATGSVLLLDTDGVSVGTARFGRPARRVQRRAQGS